MVKDTIKIFCRIKPTKSKSCLYSIEEDENILKSTLEFVVPKEFSDGYVNNKKENYIFGFQKVFDQKSSQNEVFDDVAKGVIDNVLDGYNGTIFAYGQTGSGKTFTITGGVEKYSDRGIIPRALSYIFKKYDEQKDLIHSTEISYLEIYNHSGYDLLDPRHEAKKLEELPKVTLVEDTNQNIHLRNMSVVPAQTEEEALNLLFLGDTNRMVAETPMNQASTRSHCIFTVHITSREPGSATIKTSKLHLVDLAGSERVAKTGVGGQLLTEAKYINLSLHFLEQVIVSLSDKKRQHVPYRNSMMTSVLRDSLGGNCMTTMIATVSESISTCRFAQRVAMIKNEAVLNEELDPKLMIARLKKEIENLKSELELVNGDVRSDSIDEEEFFRLNQLIDDYIEAEDLEMTLNVGGDIRKVQYCYQRFKKLIKEKPSCPPHDSDQPVLDDYQVKRLKEILEQRDNEISILVNMLKKERMKKSSQSQLASSESSIEGHKTKDFRLSGNETNELSDAKEIAFEEFKQENEDFSHIQDQKETLKIRYSEAKKLGQDVNNARSKINELKNILNEMKDEVEVDEDHEDEEVIRKQIDVWKNRYKSSFNQLKSMKTEIDHLHYLLEKSRVTIQNQFESWWSSKSQKFEDQKKTSHEASSSNKSSEEDTFKDHNSSTTSNIPLTGDRETDANILAFVKARQQMLRN